MSQFPSSGIPGVGVNALSLAYRTMFTVDTGPGDFVPGGRLLDGANTRDPDNTQRSDEARAGLVLGKITATSLLAAAIIGVSQNALTSAGTTVTLTAAEAVELVRRNGATGTFILTGPPVASGVVRSITATYSAVNQSTGAVTITALGVNEVQTVAMGVLMTAGAISVTATKSDGTLQTVHVPYNTSWTQTVADIATALNGVLGASAVACAVTNTHDFTTTFSGTGYAALPQPFIYVDGSNATSTTTAIVTRTTAGVDGRMVAGAYAGAGDGSETPVTFLVGPTPIRVTDITGASMLTAVPLIPMTTKPVNVVNIINYPTDTSLIAWLKSKLRAAVPGMTFSDDL